METVIGILLLWAIQAPEPSTIRVTGRATLSVAPEHAQVDLGVVTEAQDAQTAARDNAEKIDAVLKALRAALGSDATFETSSYSLQPVYRPREPRSPPVLVGYTATNNVRVSELALDAVGRTIDVATAAGANSVRNIAFTLRDEDAATKQALRQAAVSAQEKARTLAEALGVRIARILSVSEGEPDVIRPLYRERSFEMAQAAADVPTPVEPGAIEIRASVTLVVEIAP